MRKSLVSLLLVCLLGNGALAAEFESHTLPSGKLVKVLGIVRMHATDADALLLKYRTDISIDDVASLEREADEIWSEFRVNVERAGLSYGIISANEPERAILGSFRTTNRSHQILYKKARNGTWKRLPNRPS